MVETDNQSENSCVDTDFTTVKQRSINNRQNGSTVSDEKQMDKAKQNHVNFLRKKN